MATVIITIPKPILPPGGKFTIRYRLVGTTDWTVHGLEDNDPFTLTVPDYGNYEIEATESDCPPFIFGPAKISSSLKRKACNERNSRYCNWFRGL